MPPDAPDHAQALEQAIAAHGRGDLAAAIAGYRVARADPASRGDACHGLGIAAWQAGQLAQAEQELSAAIAADPADWRYPCTLGRLLASAGRHESALGAFDQALAQRRDAVAAWSGRAASLHALGRLEAAAAAYVSLLTLQPGEAGVLNDYGVVLSALGRTREAIEVFESGLAAQPGLVALYNNLGNALLDADEVSAARRCFGNGLALAPDSAELWFNAGNAHVRAAANDEAEAAYRSALERDPGHVRCLINLGNLLRQTRRFADALECYVAARTLDPRCHDAWNNAGAVLARMGRLDPAVASLQEALRLVPDSASAHHNLGNARKDAGQITAALEHYRRAAALAPDDPEVHGTLIYCLSFDPAASSAQIAAEARRFGARHCRDHPPLAGAMPRRPPRPSRRLRIGYVSPDFRDHCQSLFTVPLLECHDRADFEIHGFADLPAPDALSGRIAGLVDHWQPTTGCSDARLAGMIAAAGIDIAVDLTMHMARGRPGVFARQPAPVQLAWLAYPGTTGVPQISHRLTDPWLDPPDLPLHDYTEQTAWLPDTFWCYHPLDGADLEVNDLPALRAGHVTFACLNNFCKVSEPSLQRWGEVMAAVPDSRLLLLAPAGRHRERVLDRLAHQGVAAHRVEFVSWMPRSDYLALYHRIDLCLDTLPYNGHTTSLDAYWMGVPVVTQVGTTVAGRAGWSQLNNLGLPELAACDGASFVALATALACDLPRLAALRGSLRARLQTSALMDAARFARALEAVYRSLA